MFVNALFWLAVFGVGLAASAYAFTRARRPAFRRMYLLGGVMFSIAAAGFTYRVLSMFDVS